MSIEETRRKLKPIWDENAVEVTISVSDEAVAAFADLIQSGGYSVRSEFLRTAHVKSLNGMHFIRAYLQDQQRPERFEMVANFLSSANPTSSGSIPTLDYALRNDDYESTHLIGETFKYLIQYPETLAKFLSKEGVMKALDDLTPRLLTKCFDALQDHPTLLSPLLQERLADVRGALEWQQQEASSEEQTERSREIWCRKAKATGTYIKNLEARLEQLAAPIGLPDFSNPTCG
jgi:Arc/MetJ-type ribon-helix-helix transcriptional regulator